MPPEFDDTSVMRGAETFQDPTLQYERSMLEASPNALIMIGPNGGITDVNETTVELIGWSRRHLISRQFSDLFTEPGRAREAWQMVFASGSVTDYPLTLRHEDGRLIEVVYNMTIYRDTRGSAPGVFATARDVTAENRILREFAATKDLLDNILHRSIKYSIIEKDLDLRIVTWNEGAQRNYRYTAEEVIGRDSTFLHVPEDIRSGAVRQMLQTAYDKGLAEGEFERVRKDGTSFWASIIITRRNDAAGNPIGYLLMSSDTSDKKQAEEQACAAGQYARNLIEATLDPLVTINAEGSITDVNKATIKVTGVPREALIGTEFSNYFTVPARAREGYEQVFANGSVTDYPLTFRHRDGHLTEVLCNAAIYRNIRGGVVAAARDITAQKRVEAEIAEQRHKDLERLEELEQFKKLTVGRELKMIELKKVIAELRRRQSLAGMEFSTEPYATPPQGDAASIDDHPWLSAKYPKVSPPTICPTYRTASA